MKSVSESWRLYEICLAETFMFLGWAQSWISKIIQAQFLPLPCIISWKLLSKSFSTWIHLVPNRLSSPRVSFLHNSSSNLIPSLKNSLNLSYILHGRLRDTATWNVLQGTGAYVPLWKWVLVKWLKWKTKSLVSGCCASQEKEHFWQS